MTHSTSMRYVTGLVEFSNVFLTGMAVFFEEGDVCRKLFTKFLASWQRNEANLPRECIPHNPVNMIWNKKLSQAIRLAEWIPA